MNQLGGKEAYNKLQEMLKEKRDNFRIMERQVDIDVQMEYFEAAKKTKKSLPESAEKLLEDAEEKLNNPELPEDEKKDLLNQLASFEDVKAFRILEAYLEKPDENLKDWAYMAYQESLMLLESSFSEEDKVFISSGMGGKADKLRYFVVFIKSDSNEEFSEIQLRLIRKEVKYQFEKNNAELESDSYNNKFYTFKCLIPLQVNISSLFKDIIDEINQFGNFLGDNFLVTNVKEMDFDEIEEFIKAKQQEAEDYDELSDDDIENPFDDEDE